MPDEPNEAFKPVTTHDVSDEGLVFGLYREISRQVKYTNELIERKVIPAQELQGEKFADLSAQVQTLEKTVSTFDGRLVNYDDRIVALEETSQVQGQEHPKLVERISALETVTKDLKIDVGKLAARPPSRFGVFYLAAVVAGTLLASFGIAWALH